MYPLKLYPAIKDYIWGGSKLKELFFPDCPYDVVAEAWVLSCHPDGKSIIKNGEYCDKTLYDFITDNPHVLGSNCADADFFPILIKLIDAKDNLSIQVHPDDEYALKNENGLGKTEMWYVLDCDENAQIYYGFKHSISKEEYVERIKNNTLIDVLNCVKVKKGDCFFITAGTIHAIGKNMLVAEIQQNSNTTYRVYDYGRVDRDNKPRQLHIEKAVCVTDLNPVKPLKSNDNTLANCKYFTTRIYKNIANINVDDKSFSAILCVSGNGNLVCDSKEYTFSEGDCYFLPANIGEVSLSGTFEVLETRVNLT